MKIAGIDPGNHGAVCVLDSTSPGTPDFFDIHKLNPYDLARHLHQAALDVVYIEDVHAIFGSSAKSNFGFGRSVGLAQTVATIVLRGKPLNFVQPKKWQKAVGVTARGKDIKTQVAQIAMSLYPKAIIHGPRGALLDGRSDALMIAHFALKQEELKCKS